MRWLTIFMTLTLSFVLSAGVASAHTDEQKNEWMHDWEQRASLGLTPELLDELLTFHQRHEVAASRPLTSRPSTYQGMGTNVEQWRGLVAQYGGWNVDLMLCIMAGESGGNPNAKNPRSSATGLFQVLASLWGPEYPGNLYDPGHNTWVAHQIWQQQGYGAWAVYNKGKC